MNDTLPRPLATALKGAALPFGATSPAQAQGSEGWQFEAWIKGWFTANG